MSDQVWIALIGAVAVVIVLVAFRGRLTGFKGEVGPKGVRAQMQAQPRQEHRPGPNALVIEGVRQFGWMHQVSASTQAVIRNIFQLGAKNRVDANSDPASDKKASPIRGGQSRGRTDR
jgi:hypothetical protein